MSRLAALLLAVVLALPATSSANNPTRARCHGVERPRLGLGIPGGPWACRPNVGWYWPTYR